MRPKLLDIEGLQSFREAQRIDFETLGETGLFGIFGPTGSGKSTILDAITFALYGRVKRAERGTQGIINTNMNTVKVAFTFELLKGGSRKTYRVERTYQRKKGSENSCEAKVARLIEVTGVGDIPVCDKASEVSGCVEELLGLGHDDFTRAVVLPQNSFQEFLLLDNSKKRDMLERIFYLEEYGRQLAEKLNRKLTGLRSRIDVLSGELKGYADATAEALEEAGKELEAATAERSRASKEFKLMEARYNEAREVWQLVRDLTVVGERESRHALSREVTDGKRTALERAVKAESLLSPIRKNRELSIKLEDTEKQLEDIMKNLPGAAGELDGLRKTHEELKKEAALEQPRLAALKASLAEAVSIRNELGGLQVRLGELRAAAGKLETGITEKNEEAGKYKAGLEALEKNLSTLAAEAKGLAADPEYRQQIQEGLQLEKELEDLAAREKELKEKATALGEGIAASEQKLVRARDDMEKCRGELDRAAAQTNGSAAYMLSKTLKEGMPCPVCGSVHHPEPAAAVDEMELEEMETLETWKKNLEEYRLAEASILTELKVNRESLAQIAKALEAANAQHTLKRQELEGFLQKHKIQSAAAEMKRLLENDRKAVLLQNQAEKTRAEAEKKKALLEQCLEAIRILKENGIRARTETDGLEKQKGERTARFRELAGVLDIDDIEEELKRIDKKSGEYADLDRQYGESLKVLEKRYNELLNAQAALEKQQSIYSEDLKKEKELLEASLAEKGFTGTDDAEGAIIPAEEQKALKEGIREYDTEGVNIQAQKGMLLSKLNSRSITEEEWNSTSSGYQEMAASREKSVSRSEIAVNRYNELKTRHDKWTELDRDYTGLSHTFGLYEQIQKLLKAEHGKDNSFIDYIAEERLRYVAAEASETLGVMTKYKYALELDTNAGFVIRDYSNGGVHRMVTSLSGGETFLTSLSLALALSSQIQLKGQSPLEFFFLDEGFGTLDNELLDTVLDSLDRIGKKDRVIGLISHVPEIRNRLARSLVVEAPSPLGGGSRARLEKA